MCAQVNLSLAVARIFEETNSFMQRTPRILWADDEIDLLKPHLLFLEGKGFHVTAVNSGVEALEKLGVEVYDLVFLDEQMPGINGLETLARIKEQRPHLPVIMITKSEEEHIMEEAIGSKISDYLIKPVNPNQILLAIKKNLDERRLVSEKAMSDYQREFREISMQLMDRLDASDWTAICSTCNSRMPIDSLRNFTSRTTPSGWRVREMIHLRCPTDCCPRSCPGFGMKPAAIDRFISWSLTTCALTSGR
jgi:CheY-like chemotaxis protein